MAVYIGLVFFVVLLLAIRVLSLERKRLAETKERQLNVQNVTGNNIVNKVKKEINKSQKDIESVVDELMLRAFKVS